MLHAVQSFGGLTSLGGSLGNKGVVLDAANDAKSLNGVRSLVQSDPHYGVDAERVETAWGLEHAMASTSGPQTYTWDVHGLTGFSLRYGFDTWGETDQTNGAQIIVDSMVRDELLILQLSNTAGMIGAEVVAYRITMTDGKPLPRWLERAGADLMLGKRPTDVETIQLRIVAVMADGRTVTRDVVVVTQSGEIQPLKLEKRTEFLPLFSDQLMRRAESRVEAIEQLRRAVSR